MIKNFNYKGITVRVKTNILKGGKLYFGEKNLIQEIVQAYSDASYGKDDITDENILIDMYKSLAKKGIKAHELVYNGLVHEGTNMSHLENQKTLKEE